MAVLEGCEGARKTPVLMEIKCPKCGADMEVFARDNHAVEDFKCEKCGYTIHEGDQI